MHACGATGNLRVIRTNDFFGVCICWVSLDHGLVTTHRSGLDADLTSTTRGRSRGCGIGPDLTDALSVSAWLRLESRLRRGSFSRAIGAACRIILHARALSFRSLVDCFELSLENVKGQVGLPTWPSD